MNPDPGLAGWLQLTLTPGIGSSALRSMLRQFGLPENIVGRKTTELSSFAERKALEAMHSDEVRAAVSRTMEWAKAPAHGVITLADAAYPRALLEISDPPALLYTIGRVELLQRPALAVVGSR